MRVLLVGEAGPLAAGLEEAGLQLTREDVDAAYLVSVAPPVELAPLADLGADDWLRVFDAWATEVFFAVQPWLAASAARGSGSWVAVTSDARHAALSRRRRCGRRRDGLHTLVRIAALEGGPNGVRANVVAPGWSEAAFPSGLDPELAVLDTPLRRLVTPADIAAAVAWLLSPAAAQVTGEILRVDGGYTITRGSRTDPRRQ